MRRSFRRPSRRTPAQIQARPSGRKPWRRLETPKAGASQAAASAVLGHESAKKTLAAAETKLKDLQQSKKELEGARDAANAALSAATASRDKRQQPIRSLAFSADGNVLALAGDDPDIAAVRRAHAAGRSTASPAIRRRSAAWPSARIRRSSPPAADKQLVAWETNPRWTFFGRIGPKADAPLERGHRRPRRPRAVPGLQSRREAFGDRRRRAVAQRRAQDLEDPVAHARPRIQRRSQRHGLWRRVLARRQIPGERRGRQVRESLRRRHRQTSPVVRGAHAPGAGVSAGRPTAACWQAPGPTIRSRSGTSRRASNTRASPATASRSPRFNFIGTGADIVSSQRRQNRAAAPGCRRRQLPHAGGRDRLPVFCGRDRRDESRWWRDGVLRLERKTAVACRPARGNGNATGKSLATFGARRKPSKRARPRSQRRRGAADARSEFARPSLTSSSGNQPCRKQLVDRLFRELESIVSDRSAHAHQSARGRLENARRHPGLSLLHRAGPFGRHAAGADRRAGTGPEGKSPPAGRMAGPLWKTRSNTVGCWRCAASSSTFTDDRITPANWESLYDRAAAKMAAPDWETAGARQEPARAGLSHQRFRRSAHRLRHDALRSLPADRRSGVPSGQAGGPPAAGEGDGHRGRLPRRSLSIGDRQAVRALHPARRPGAARFRSRPISSRSPSTAASVDPILKAIARGPRADGRRVAHAVAIRLLDAGRAVCRAPPAVRPDDRRQSPGLRRRGLPGAGPVRPADVADSISPAVQCLPAGDVSDLRAGQTSNQELVSYSWIFPNVVTNGHWWYSNIPAYIELDCRSRLQAVPADQADRLLQRHVQAGVRAAEVPHVPADPGVGAGRPISSSPAAGRNAAPSTWAGWCCGATSSGSSVWRAERSRSAQVTRRKSRPRARRRICGNPTVAARISTALESTGVVMREARRASHVRRSQAMPTLVLLQGGRGDSLSGWTATSTVLGRAPECQIQLDSNMVSRRHAQVVRDRQCLFTSRTWAAATARS